MDKEKVRAITEWQAPTNEPNDTGAKGSSVNRRFSSFSLFDFQSDS